VKEELSPTVDLDQVGEERCAQSYSRPEQVGGGRARVYVKTDQVRERRAQVSSRPD